MYLAGHLLFKHLMHHTLSIPRLSAVGAMVVVLPAAAFLPALVGLTLLVLILVVLVVVETARYAQVRQRLRNG